MNPEDIAKILDDLGKRLGPSGEHVFQLAIRQTIIHGVLDLIFGAVAISLAIYVWRKGKSWVFSQELDSYGDAILDRGLPMTGISIATIVLLGIGVASLYGSVTEILNPEYEALSNLLGQIIK